MDFLTDAPEDVRELLDYNELLSSQVSFDELSGEQVDLSDILAARDASLDLVFLALEQH